MKKIYFFLITALVSFSHLGYSQITYTFDGEFTDWAATNFSQLTQNTDPGGYYVYNMQIDPNQTPTNTSATGYDRGNNGAQLYLDAFPTIDADTYKFVTIKLRNLTINPRLVFRYTDPADSTNKPTIELSGPIATEEAEGVISTYTFDLSAESTWAGAVELAWFMFRLNPLGSAPDPDTNKVELEKAAGQAYIYEISFTASAPLSIGDVDFRDDSKVSLYPNPASDVVNINSQRNLEKIEIFNVTGRLVKTTMENLNSVDVSSFKKGVYFAKIYQDGAVSTKRFLKN